MEVSCFFSFKCFLREHFYKAYFKRYIHFSISVPLQVINTKIKSNCQRQTSEVFVLMNDNVWTCWYPSSKLCKSLDFHSAFYWYDGQWVLAVCKTVDLFRVFTVFLSHVLLLWCVLFDCSDILHIDKQNADAVYVRGMCLYYQDNVEQAFTHFQHVLRLAPDHQKAMNIYKVCVSFECKRTTVIECKMLCIFV